MRIRGLSRILGVGLILFLAFQGTAWSQEALPPDYDIRNASIMRPDLDTLLGWVEEARNAPATFIDEEINMRTPPYGSSHSLISHVEYTPAERDQGSCGNCWNWAGTGVLEVALSVHGTKDRLSIQYLNSCKTDKFACCGGWLQYFADWYGGVGFSVPWSNTNASFQDGSTQCNAGQSIVSCGSIPTQPNYPITSIQVETVPTTGVGQATAIANIKNVLNQNKAIWFGFFLPDFNPFINFWSGAGASETTIWNPDTICGQTKIDGGHAVLLVGYNDDDPDPSKHYWIMLNSWGTADGKRPNGLYRHAMRVNYDCFLTVSGQNVNTLIFQTLNISFGGTGTCTYSLSPTSKTFNSAGGSDSITVTTQSGCAWTAAESLDWVTINSGGSGTGSGTVNYTVSANPNPASRTGTMTIGGKTFTITQEGTSTLPTNVLLNPGFEEGNTHWTEYNTYDYDVITNYYLWAHSGNWFAWLGGFFDEESYIYQDITIPAGAAAAYLQFWYDILTLETESTPYDTMTVWVLRPGDNAILGTLVTLSNVNYTEDWTLSGMYDMTAFKGQPIRLAFYSLVDSDLPTFFFVDDITLGVSYPVSETVSPPTTPAGPASGTTGTSYNYSVDGSVSSLGHSVQYFFDWGNSTNSGWLPVGTKNASKSWSLAGTYQVKAKARCSTDQSVESGWSPILQVTITGGGGSGTATRSLPAYYSPSVPVSVTITVTPEATVSTYAVEDSPPTGWTVGSINESGTWDNVNKKVKWGPFFDHNARSLTYQATPPAGETGTKSFSGTASFDGANVTIGGSSTIELGGYHPADTDHDFRISIAEVTAYGAAWKTGQTWPTPPNPIPIEYVTNAGYIWKVGEVYHYDGGKYPPYDPGP